MSGSPKRDEVRRPMADFDNYSGDYKEIHNRNISVSGEDTDYFTRLKLRLVRDALGGEAAGDFRLLDIGSGVGKVQQFLPEFLPACRSAAVDISFASLRTARREAGAGHLFACYDGERLPFADKSFDCVLLCTVLHHVPPERRGAMMAEAARVLAPGGRVFVFEHNPFNPLTQRLVRTCEFDEDAKLVSARESRRLLNSAGLGAGRATYYIFFPGFLRILRPLEPSLARLPLGGQYMIIARAGS